jgi:hypothetical protein
MRRIPLLLVLLALAGGLAAQGSASFAVLPPGRSITLAKGDSSFFYLRIDSTYRDGPDSVVVFPPVIDSSTTPGCAWDTDAPGFLGPRMIVQPDGRHVFFNAVGDSIFLYPDFGPSDPWVFYRYDDGTGNYIEAVPFQLATTALIPGYRDSIKVVQLIGRLPGGAPRPSDPYHATFLGLTEFNGFFRGFRLPDVPNPPTTLNHQWRGITDPDTGWVHLNRRRVLDLQPGNERHVRTYIRTGAPGAAIETEDFSGYLTLARRFSPEGDTLLLDTRLARFRVTESEASGTVDTLRLVDTIELSFPLAEYAFLDAFPGEPFTRQEHGYAEQYRDTLIFGRAFKRIYDDFAFNAAEGCLEPLPGPRPEWVYIDGLELFHYANAPADDPGFVRMEVDLVYYQKDLEVWGTPYDFDALLATGLPAVPAPLTLHLRPNPASAFTEVLGPARPGTLRVFDVTGRPILERPFPGERLRLATAGWPAGIYLIELRHGARAGRARLLVP